jgi:uncharacterized membrane protein (DUF4010 family)|tara:strand:- start:95 stop:958 length:864 start_codon:yes stop_codon:yes gene_type:complete
MEHKTPLSYHFKDKHIWFDMTMLVALFVVAAYVPLLKIVPLVACLELFSFFSFHLLAKRRRFQLQGFLGGFISSTAVFIQILNDKKFASTSERDLLLTLLFALCSMLLECLFIIFFLADQLSFIFYIPFVTQLMFFITVITYVQIPSNLLFLSNQSRQSTVDIELLIDHPISWKNVAKLSIFILALVYGMNFIGSELGLSRGISTLLVSFFEAHAILVSVMTEWSMNPQDIDLITLLLLILLGNSISKSYLVFKGSNFSHKWFFIAMMLVGFALSVGVTYLCSLLLE